MNDRYLFRGKRVGNGEWVEGDLVHLPNGTVILANGYAYVIPETVGQCTGLKDKNGKLIFEGDVLSYDEKRGVVKYKNACYVFWWKGFNKYRLDCFKECILTNYAGFDNLEIIGNIHDNPELLGVKE